MLHSFDDPADLTPERCRREVASILARGVLRLCEKLHDEPPESMADPPDKGLDVSAPADPTCADG